MERDNEKCGVGIAYNVNIGGMETIILKDHIDERQCWQFYSQGIDFFGQIDHA